ncbi:patatin-like phospholipase family protein [Roseibium sediminis]|uniref:patatin-like phospholipase family protein n=1 Tax=Roseibium sediminis TaxID=1775174 RepID=UPI00123D1FF5|nr:patatin-like phospholipase family protein [Roseibium sediminis]
MTAPRIGLALGGGGARGMSHIPVLEAFDQLGIRPHAITGTSIGSILGAAYAAGRSGQEVREIALELFADRNAVLASLWKLRPKKLTDIFTGSTVTFDPLKVLEAFVAHHLPETFEDLEVPFKAIATDFYGCEEVVLESGPLLPAIAASIAIPAVFRPVKRNDRILIDGGVANPLPFDRLPADCDIIVAVDVVGGPVPRADREAPTSLDTIFGSSQILMQSITQQKLKQSAPALLLRPENDNVRVLDFLKTRQVLEKAEDLRLLTIQRLTQLIAELEKNN